MEREIFEARKASAEHLTALLGPGPWSSKPRIETVRDRIAQSDPDLLRRKSLFAAVLDGCVVGSVAASKFHPSFWKKHLWQDPKASAIGVFDLVVHPAFQGRGYGRFLIGGIESLAPKFLCTAVRLDAFAENPRSMGFYRAIRYSDRGRIDVRGCPLQLFERVLPEQLVNEIS